MDLQAAWKEKARVKKEEGDAKIKEDKKWKDKLDKIEAANKEEFEKFENHDEKQLEAHGKIEHEHALTVEKLVENTLEDDSVGKIDKLAHVIGHLSRAINPMASHERIPLLVSLNTSVQASGLVMEEKVEVAMQIRKSLFTMIGILTRRSYSHLSCKSRECQLDRLFGYQVKRIDSLLSIIAIDPFQFQI
jgi:hypothetical protein